MRAERVSATKPSPTPGRSWTRASQGPWARIAGWVPMMILAVLLMLPAAAAEQTLKDQVDEAKATVEDLEETVNRRVGSPGSLLFFTELPLDETDDRWNFTASPPGSETAPNGTRRDAAIHETEGFQASWSWYLPTTPAIWNVRPGDQWGFVLYIEGLTMTPGDDEPDSIYTIDVQAVSSAGVHANGTMQTSRLDMGEGPHRYVLTAVVDEHYEFYPNKSDPQVEIRITVSANEHVSPDVRFHYGTLDNPSRLTLPRYPQNALSEMRAADPPSAGPDIDPPCNESPTGRGCSQDPEAGDDGGEQEEEGSTPQSGPHGPQDPESAATVKTGDAAGPGLQEEAPQDESPADGDPDGDAISTASTSGVIALLAWTLFVASAGSYGRAERSKQENDAPRIVGRPKEPGSPAKTNQARTRKPGHKD